MHQLTEKVQAVIKSLADAAGDEQTIHSIVATFVAFLTQHTLPNKQDSEKFFAYKADEQAALFTAAQQSVADELTAVLLLKGIVIRAEKLSLAVVENLKRVTAKIKLRDATFTFAVDDSALENMTIDYEETPDPTTGLLAVKNDSVIKASRLKKLAAYIAGYINNQRIETIEAELLSPTLSMLEFPEKVIAAFYRRKMQLDKLCGSDKFADEFDLPQLLKNIENIKPDESLLVTLEFATDYIVANQFQLQALGQHVKNLFFNMLLATKDWFVIHQAIKNIIDELNACIQKFSAQEKPTVIAEQSLQMIIRVTREIEFCYGLLLQRKPLTILQFLSNDLLDGSDYLCASAVKGHEVAKIYYRDYRKTTHGNGERYLMWLGTCATTVAEILPELNRLSHVSGWKRQGVNALAQCCLIALTAENTEVTVGASFIKTLLKYLKINSKHLIAENGALALQRFEYAMSKDHITKNGIYTDPPASLSTSQDNTLTQQVLFTLKKITNQLQNKSNKKQTRTPAWSKAAPAKVTLELAVCKREKPASENPVVAFYHAIFARS
jgi:hypothetical protein